MNESAELGSPIVDQAHADVEIEILREELIETCKDLLTVYDRVIAQSTENTFMRERLISDIKAIFREEEKK